jgi:hypothetical protein
MQASSIPVRETGGQLPAYAWPGGYPLFYLDNHGSVLCADCATDTLDDEYSAELVACDINYEEPLMYCDQCDKHIEPAYGDD